MKYKYLLFDLDGTLINTMEGVVKSAQFALKHLGIEHTLKELEPFLGPPLKDSFLNFGLNEEQTLEAVAIYRQRYKIKSLMESEVFPEIPDLLQKLKNAGYILGVATSKLEKQAEDMLRGFGLADVFDHIVGSSVDASINKKHEVIEEALKRFGISSSRENALMIGDMKYDDIGAKAAGIDSFGVYTGTAKENEHEEAGATYIAYSFKELENLLLGEFYSC